MRIEIVDGVNAFGAVGYVAVNLIDDDGNCRRVCKYGCMVVTYDMAFKRALKTAAKLSRKLGGVKIEIID